MKLKGIVGIFITDSSGDIRTEIIQENLIPDNSWLQLLGSNSSRNYFGSRLISISQDTRTPIASISTINNVIATAAPPAGVTTPIWNELVEPIFGQIIGRIGPIGTVRVFNSVALTALSAANTQNTSALAYAWLKLDIPCTQLAFDFVNITYSIQFIDDIGEGFVNKNIVRYDFGRTMFNAANFRMANLYTHLFNLQPSAVKLPPIGNPIDSYTSQSRVDSHFKWKYRLITGRDTNLGFIYNTLVQGISNNNQECYSASKFNYDKEPFQTGFFHGQNSVIPFFDANNPANSQGLIYLSGTWQGKLPELYKITITKAGNATTAEYKLSVQKHLGFNGNTLNVPNSITPYRNFNYPFVTNLHGWRQVDFDVHRFSDTEIVQYDDTGVSLVDMFDGTNQTWDSTTTPALPCTTIRQVAVDVVNKKIYVGCRITGLWMIDPIANTITNIFAIECYGVDVGRNNVVFAIVSNGLYTSTNWSVAISLTFTGLSNNNWSRTQYLKVDPENVTDRLAIIADNGSGEIRIIWYQLSTNTATLGYQDFNQRQLPNYCSGLDVSDTGSNWVFASRQTLLAGWTPYALIFYKILFNDASINNTISGFGLLLNIPKYSPVTSYYAKITFYKDAVFASISLVGSTFNYNFSNILLPSPVTGGVQVYLGNTYALHLADGIALVNNYLGQTFSGNALANIDYGWDGSQWVKDNTGSKVCHTADQALINGLLIRFQNGASNPQFSLNEYYTQGLNFGLLKDNATDLEITAQWYSKSVYYANINITIPSIQITLPVVSGEQYFRIIETDDTTLHSLKIANIPVTKIYTDLVTVPLASEIRLQSNGVVAFNSADVGKSFTGKYLWISS